MLEKPTLPDQHISDVLREQYRLMPTRIVFLPLGADRNTAVYKAESETGAWFVKLRGGAFDEATVNIPKWLYEGGLTAVIPPLPNRHGLLWTPLEPYSVIVYPFVGGQNGFERDLTAAHWVTLGEALKKLHTVTLPPNLLGLICHETYAAAARLKIKGFQAHSDANPVQDVIAAELTALLRDKRAEIDALIDAAHQFAAILQARSLPYVLCHADIHVGNLLITPDEALYLVDWDTMTFAPKERDLMFMGMGLGSAALHSHDTQAALFFQGYGETAIDATALAYYRCERVVQDIAEYCEQLFFSDGADRHEGLRQLQSQFEPDGVVERALTSARRAARALRGGN